MLLGVAYQSGLLPLDLENIKWAMKIALQRDFDTNNTAFDMGRRLALDPSFFSTIFPIQSSALSSPSIFKSGCSIVEKSRAARARLIS